MGSRIERLSRWVVVAATAVAAGALRAEDAPPAGAAAATGPAPGHSIHGEAFDEGPRRSAYLMGTTGPAVHFPVTTRSPAAQAFFNQGVGQLHGFWYLEAERSFRQAAALDPSCAMAYWGMAMANVNNPNRAKTFIAKAAERAQGLTRPEALWIEALDAYHKADPADDQGRRSNQRGDVDAEHQQQRKASSGNRVKPDRTQTRRDCDHRAERSSARHSERIRRRQRIPKQRLEQDARKRQCATRKHRQQDSR